MAGLFARDLWLAIGLLLPVAWGASGLGIGCRRPTLADPLGFVGSANRHLYDELLDLVAS